MMIRIIVFGILLLQTGWVVAQTAAFERFDTSGMPAQPTTFLEQQIWDAVKHHHAGDALDAMLIQRKLARYYQDKGDLARAQTASRLATAAEQSNTGGTPASGQASIADSSATGGTGQLQAESAPRENIQTAPRGAFTGNYYAMVGGAMEKWDFSSNGGFTHTGAASGVGASVRNFERGTYEIAGGTLILHVANTENAYATNRTIGSSRDTAVVTRKSKVQLLGAHGESGMVIDGQHFSPRHGW